MSYPRARQRAINQRPAPTQRQIVQQHMRPTEPIYEDTPNGLPFQKLNISDAIGLITMRLGKLEQWVINQGETSQDNVPDGLNSAALNELINRLERVESKQGNSNDEGGSSDVANTVIEAINKTTEKITRVNDVYESLAKKVVSLQKELSQLKSSVSTVNIKQTLLENEIKQSLSETKMEIQELLISEKNPDKEQDAGFTIEDVSDKGLDEENNA